MEDRSRDLYMTDTLVRLKTSHKEGPNERIEAQLSAMGLKAAWQRLEPDADMIPKLQ